MRSERFIAVFIKPNFGSGAAGVLALSLHPGDNKPSGAFIAPSGVAGDRLVNSKHIIRYENSGDITLIVNAILQQDNIIERWLAKSQRAIKLRFYASCTLMVKSSGGLSGTSSQPITNLHLQNEAIRFADLNFTRRKVAEIDTLCLNAMTLYPDVHIAGFDVLLTQNLTPILSKLTAGAILFI